MNIAILSFYQGHVSRGVETFVSEITANLTSTCKTTVYSGSSMPSFSKPTKPGLHSYFYLDSHSLAIKKFTQKILNKLKTNPPDILISLNNGWMSLLSKRFCQRHKTKLIFIGFSGIGWDDKVNLYLNPDRFIACTQHQADWAKTINPRAKIATINVGVNTDRFKPEGKKFPLKLKPPIILSVSGPQSFKRVPLVIEAVSRLSQASLLLVGQQPEKVIESARRLLPNRFQHLEVGYQQMDSIYRSVDLFTLPSESIEAYGIAILEALASNLPVIVNNDPIRQELVGKAGILTDPTNIDDYLKAIKQALTENFGLKPRRQAMKFSWSSIAKQHQQLWSSLI